MPRKCKPQESSPYDAVRGRWEAASVAQFLKLFKSKFDFLCSSTQDLEEALVNTRSFLLADTCARLLRFLTGNCDILISNVEQHLKAAAFLPRVPDQQLGFSSPEEKVLTLKWLVDLCLERRGEELHDYLDQNHRPDDMRGLCAGQDAFNNVYWYLDDLRLYRENNVKKASRKDWECVCITLEDWIGFLKQFRKSNNQQERELYQYLNAELFPVIEHQLRASDTSKKELPSNEKLVQEEALDVAAMLKEGQQDKTKACPAADAATTKETVVNGGEDASKASSSPDNLANGEAAAQPPDPAQQSNDDENKSSNEGVPENQMVNTANIKTEENSNSNQEFTSGNANVTNAQQTAGDGGQPLPSNVLPKQAPAEAQYMQQQSQIFVFTTKLANEAAECVLQGQYPSIIACHCEQPGTKKYLEKHPLKLAQFSRHQQNSAQWLNSFAQMKQQHQSKEAPFSNPKGIPPPSGPPSMVPPDMAMNNWNQGGNPSMVTPVGQVNSPMKSCASPMMGAAPIAQGSPNSQMHASPMMGPGLGSPNNPAMSQQSLMGVKVPDENLTPQQRQHREEQLATLRKMHQMLFPEQQAGVPQTGNSTDMMGGFMMTSARNPPTSMAAQIEWHKLQHQFFEDKTKKKGGRGRGQTMLANSQGPPPPYHQSTTRSASVPVALASPGTPSSPGNATGAMGSSTLSLPSPLASSSLNSPGGFATPTQQQQRCLAGPSPSDSPRANVNISNPGTPIAGPSPGHKEEFSPAQQNTGDSIFVRGGFPHQKNAPTKEANLMPVPSPQQIQYLNTFEGQELTIQKQPNTSIRESDIMSPTLPSAPMENADRASEPPMTPSYTGPNTPGAFSAIPGSPHTPQQTSEKCKTEPNRFPPSSPSGSRFQSTTPIAPSPSSQDPNFVKHQNFPSESSPKLSPGSNSNFQPENMPLNPNNTTGNTVHKTSSHFDPITSMAQMSQQLTSSGSPVQNNAPPPGMMPMNTPAGYMPVMGGPFGGPMHHNMEGMPGNMMPQAQPPPHMQQGNYPQPPPPHMGMCGGQGSPPMMPGHQPPSPKGMMMMQPRGSPPVGQPYPGQRMMMTRPPYNGASIQVKASAPNTIQYLPARPQSNNQGPRGPPSLDFLQRFANPLSNLDSKVPTHNLQYFPNNNGQNNPNINMGGPQNSQMPQMGGLPPQMVVNNALGPGSVPMGPGGVPMGPVGGSMGGSMGHGGSMMPSGPPPNGQMMGPGMNGPMGMGCVRGQRPPHLMRGGTMFQQSPALPPPQDQQQGFPNPNAAPTMFVPGAKASPMGHAPDASQPLPPSMGQATNFKNSPFIGPSTSDPNYAQQFHNFQQQLYATNTRSQMNNQTINQNQLFFGGPK